ncbi:2-keto-4-pentenoate hydratase/2-oxohepta-3-ene-1,7-dioic acid hydratase in catechol pathway [Pullulanibacillus pueri]|uniref:Uncharacterized protein n=1 Tax=Pullulanibacillus pueri TaxID=1437324 RepID=A0A8J3A002_9BACL|nr:fumarylacetoacetate hydrolase family protein [Pullulanibacillus pueri]MBM7683844.1 2-keto-4-pentenoate hydratase/2-oxohepta-3-ene-1,7-dioic acid hydratase in catechol pathway [Pullulanibacillus pueri]GGH87711.1 hypothetical protein GCM10007096_38350 [Pullulanibacillus pueri]
MKYCRFLHEGQIKYGMIDVDRVIELKGSYLKKTSAPTDRVHYIDDVTLLCPVEPYQMVAIGLNYVDHAKELSLPLPEEPMMFMVSPTALTGPDETILLAKPDHRIDFEAELVIVIGKKAHKVSKEKALDSIFGYTIGLDISDRDLQMKDGQFTRSKSYPTYKPMGPVVETDLQANKVPVQLRQNGEIKQDGNTNNFVHSIEKIIETVTDVMTLYPGDIILTGSPAGVGPLQEGDKLEATIPGIGILKNTVALANR